MYFLNSVISSLYVKVSLYVMCNVISIIYMSVLFCQ